MNHLGEVVVWFMLSGYTGVMSMAVVCIILVDGHPGTKRLETLKREASSATISHMGSVLTN
jgi:hypothetical protein